MRSAIKTMALAAALALTGCTAADLLEHASEAPLPRGVRNTMQAKGMTAASPIMIRVFKEEAELEVWKQTDTGRYDLVKTYEICAYSGDKGPKVREGDRQAPEGFYFINRGLLNPNSSYHLAFNLGFPNAFDRALGRTGSFLMIHGDCSSRGCYAMTDKNMTEIYAFARDALRGGQKEFQVQAFPFRMTPENMARYHDSPHFDYWSMLKSGYDHFELTHMPPKVDVCNRRYIFNMVPNDEDAEFVASQACPAGHLPAPIASAYTQLTKNYALEFEKALASVEGRDFDPARAAVDPATLAPEQAPNTAIALSPAAGLFTGSVNAPATVTSRPAGSAASDAAGTPALPPAFLPAWRPAR